MGVLKLSDRVDMLRLLAGPKNAEQANLGRSCGLSVLRSTSLIGVVKIPRQANVSRCLGIMQVEVDLLFEFDAGIANAQPVRTLGRRCAFYDQTAIVLITGDA